MKYIIIGLIFLVGCTNVDKTKETLRKSGYKNVTTGGYSWLSCGKDDLYSTKFTAINPNNEQVDGVICCGLLFKGCTVRF